MKSFPFPAVLLAAALGCLPLPISAQSIDQSFQALARYDYGDSREPLLALQTILNGQNAAERKATEARFLALLEREDVPTGAKDVICRWLGVMGTPASVPALQKLMAHPRLNFLAVAALMDQPSPEASAALLEGLKTAPPALRPALIGALGRRQTTEAVPALTEIATQKDSEASAAWTALGAIGSPGAVRALQGLPDQGNTTLAWAKINGAFRLIDEHPEDSALAAAIFRQMDQSPARVAAAGGLLRLQDPAALAALRKLLQDKDAILRRQAAGLVAGVSAPEAFGLLAADFSQWNPETQQAVLLASGQHRGAPAHALWKEALAGSDPAVRQAALRALGTAGDLSALPLLLPLLASAPDAAVAAESLKKIPGPAVTAQLREALTSTQGSAHAALLLILADRQDADALPAAFTATQSSDADLRAAGFQALGLLARSNDLPRILALSSAIKTPEDRKSWNKTILVMVQNSPDTAAAAAALQTAIGEAGPDSRPALLLALASVNGPEATTLLQHMLQSGDLDRRKEIIRTLSGVRTVSSLELLLATARAAQDPSERMLALRGYLDGIRSRTDFNPDESFEAYQQALAIATEPAEKDAILAAMKGLKTSKKAELFLKKQAEAK